MNQATESECICGVIMPISQSDEIHTAAHWNAVLQFISEAVEAAGMTAQPVWENGDFDIIQAKILRNLFENEIVICDVSTKNPNVMLELGMRLTTKQPTIIIAEVGTILPFDTSVISTEFYEPSLRYGEITVFVQKLTKILVQTRASALAGTYHTYLEHFRFETVEPGTVTISGQEAIADRLDEMNFRLTKLDSRISAIQPERYPSGLPTGFTEDFSISERSSESAKNWPTKARADLAVGIRVRHSKFGDGAIAEIEGNKLEVDFDAAGRKRVLDSFVTPI